MKLILDGKSLVVGLIAGVALAVGLGAVQTDEPQVGRFQIDIGDTSGREAYVLDTVTGQIWNSRNSGSKFEDAKLGNQQ